MISYSDCPICNKKLETGTFGTIDAGPGEYSGTLLEMYSGESCIGHRFENICTLDKDVISATVEIPLRQDTGEVSVLVADKPFSFRTDLVLRVTNIHNEHFEKKKRNNSSSLFVFPSIRYAAQKAGLAMTGSGTRELEAIVGIDYSLDYIENNTVKVKRIIDFDFPTLEKLKRKAKLLLTFQ